MPARVFRGDAETFVHGRILRAPSGCWIAMGARTTDGYGKWRAYGFSTRRAHRIAYEMLVGPIPDGLVLDHLCRQKACVNPAHLQPVRQRTNTLRGSGLTAQYASREKCYRGHPYSPENTYYPRAGGRECRACRAVIRAGSAARKRVAA